MAADRHGTLAGYAKDKCRCEECTAAWSDYARQRRTRAMPATARHGTNSTYTNWGCRCDPCKQASAEHYVNHAKAVRAARRERLQAAKVTASA